MPLAECSRTNALANINLAYILTTVRPAPRCIIAASAGTMCADIARPACLVPMGIVRVLYVSSLQSLLSPKTVFV